MLDSHPLRMLPLAFLLGGLAFAGAFQLQQPAAPAPPPVLLGENGGPAWHHSEDVGNGIEMEAIVKFTDTLTNPGTGQSLRPIALHVNFLYGVGLMQQLNYLDLHAVADTTPLHFNIAGLDRNLVVPQRPPHEPVNYGVTIAPKPSFTWGTIRGAVDLDFTVIQQP